MKKENTWNRYFQTMVLCNDFGTKVCDTCRRRFKCFTARKYSQLDTLFPQAEEVIRGFAKALKLDVEDVVDLCERNPQECGFRWFAI
ncbi:MAG: hypothetical protein KJ556_20985, partial [Gammaproteobacteria bacterium]|nr:hypothetical protein [Gammaproteobacteria bacterium]